MYVIKGFINYHRGFLPLIFSDDWKLQLNLYLNSWTYVTIKYKIETGIRPNHFNYIYHKGKAKYNIIDFSFQKSFYMLNMKRSHSILGLKKESLAN